MVFLLGDFHDIQTVRMPDDLKLSKGNAYGICTSRRSSLAKSSTEHISSVPKVTFRGRETECKGGIVKSHLQFSL